jgi:hypothetical protein
MIYCGIIDVSFQSQDTERQQGVKGRHGRIFGRQQGLGARVDLTTVFLLPRSQYGSWCLRHAAACHISGNDMQARTPSRKIVVAVDRRSDCIPFL